VRRLDSIDRALDAIALGSYGVCAGCGSAIEIERLRLGPDAASCSACARSAAPSR